MENNNIEPLNTNQTLENKKEIYAQKFKEYIKNKYNNDEEYKAMKKEQTKEYYKKHKEEIAAKRKERYHEDEEYRNKQKEIRAKYYKSKKIIIEKSDIPKVLKDLDDLVL